MAEPLTVADVLAMADADGVHFKTFQAAARKFLGDATPADKPGIVDALKALPADATPAADPLDHDGNGKKGGAAKLVPVKLLRDTWQGETRIVADGSVIDLPPADARRLIDAGVAERADPLPGE